MATVQYKTVTCDECKHEFKLKPKIMKIKEVAKGIEKHFFLCPKCKHQYVVMYQDQEFKNNLNRMEVIRSQASKLKFDNDEYESLLNEHDKLRTRNLEISTQYKKIYGS